MVLVPWGCAGHRAHRRHILCVQDFLLPNFPPQRPYISFHQNVISRKDLDLVRYEWCSLLLALLHCWGDEILRNRVSGRRMGWFCGVRDSYCGCHNLKQQCPISIHCYVAWELESVHVSVLRCCIPRNREELLLSEPYVVNTCSSLDSVPFVILILPGSCKIYFHL